MSKLSRGGIAYNLVESPYYYISIDYPKQVEYRFSSQTYLDKFGERLEDNRNSISESLSKRFGLKVVNSLLSDIVLYSKIEKRGFLIYFDGVPVECLENITLDGKQPIVNN